MKASLKRRNHDKVLSGRTYSRLKKITERSVIVIAPMSAGKSTFINALIGQEILPSANMATTATITRIYNQDHLPHFLGRAYSVSGECIREEANLTDDIVCAWNADPNISRIDISGNIESLYNTEYNIVVYDTPGPNNSQDKSHEDLTMEVINNGNYGVILYVLNATQLGTNDDFTLLEHVAQVLQKDKHKRIIFILNKADCLDEEKGESIDQVIYRTVKYLIQIGFKRPTIIPTSAYLAFIIKKTLNNDSLSRIERFTLKNALENRLNNINLGQYSFNVPNKFKPSATDITVQEKNNFLLPKVDVHTMSTSDIQLLISLMIQSGFFTVASILQHRLSPVKKKK